MLEKAAAIGNIAEFDKYMKEYIEYRWCTALSFHVLVKGYLATLGDFRPRALHKILDNKC